MTGSRGAEILLCMLREADYERYRRMTPEQRLAEHSELMDAVWALLKDLPPEEIQRRLDASAAINDLSNRAALEYLREHDR